MAAPKRVTRQKPSQDSVSKALESALASMKRQGTQAIREAMGPKYGIHTQRAFGVSVANLRLLSKQHEKSHELAAALWATEWYEARMLASMVDEPARVTSAQMDRWCQDFDNWALCDTVCFNLFDYAPDAWTKVHAWSEQQGEFQKRAAFALLWSLSVHDKRASDAQFLAGLKLIERCAQDPRHFVKKAINMALRAIGKRNRALHRAALATADTLSKSADATARWVGKDALRELTSASVKARVLRRAK